MSTLTRAARRLCLLVAVAALCIYSLARGDAPVARADEQRAQKLDMGELYKWDPVESPHSPHIYQVELQQDKTTLISVLSIGVTRFRPRLSSSALSTSSGICSGRASDAAGTHDVLISCSATGANEGTYEFTVSDSAGRTPTQPYAIFAKQVDGLTRIDTQRAKTRKSWGAYKVEIYEYLRVPTISSVSFSVDADRPVVGRIYADSTLFGCEAPATCAVGNPNVERYFVVLWNLQERSNVEVALKE